MDANYGQTGSGLFQRLVIEGRNHGIRFWFSAFDQKDCVSGECAIFEKKIIHYSSDKLISIIFSGSRDIVRKFSIVEVKKSPKADFLCTCEIIHFIILIGRWIPEFSIEFEESPSLIKFSLRGIYFNYDLNRRSSFELQLSL